MQPYISRYFEATEQWNPKPPVVLALETNIHKDQFRDKSLAIGTLQTNAAQELSLLWCYRPMQPKPPIILALNTNIFKINTALYLSLF